MSSPSFTHDALIELFCHRPSIAAKLVSELLHYELPEFDHAEVSQAELTQILPTEYRADLVVLFRQGGKVVLGLVVEVQLSPKETKRFAWPLYAAAVRGKYRCPASVLVVTPEMGVANWAARPIEAGPGWRFAPLVLGPEAVPRITDPKRVRECPELVLLSLQAHSNAPDAKPIAEAALQAIHSTAALSDEQRELYLEMVWQIIGQAMRAAMEASMFPRESYEFENPWSRLLKEREARGEARGKASALLQVIRVRALALTQAQRDQILACTDLETLDSWTDRVVHVSTVDELLTPPL